jgi:hypothetical protein
VCGTRAGGEPKKIDASESSFNAASESDRERASPVSDGYKDPMDALCEDDPSADECKVFD